MQEKKRLFNGFDIAVAVIIVAAVLLWVFVINRPAQAEAPTFDGTAIYYIEVTNLNLHATEAVSAGDKLQEATKNYEIGTIIDIEVKPYETRVDDPENETIYYEVVPDKYTMVLTVEAEVDETDQEVLAGGEYALKGGLGLSFTGPGYGFNSGVILGLERGE